MVDVKSLRLRLEKLVVSLLLSSLILFWGCRESDVDNTAEIEKSQNINIDDLELNQSELDRIDELRKNGGLIIASSVYKGIYEPEDDGSYSGFHSLLIKEAVSRLDIPLKIISVNFEDFFKQNGVIPEGARNNPDVFYTPDIFKQAQLIVYDLTELEWRKKLMEFTPILPARMLVVSKRNTPIIQLGDMYGKTVVVGYSTSHESYMDRLNDFYNLNITIIRSDPSEDVLKIVDEGGADFTIRDSTSILLFIGEYEELTVSMPLGPMLTNSWALERGDIHLKSALDKILKAMDADGTKNTLFKKTYGTSLKDYTYLISQDPNGGLNLTVDEMAYLDDLRVSGGLHAAIDVEKPVYEPQTDGSAIGLHYNLLLSLADLLNLPLILEPVHFTQFFEKNKIVDDRLINDPDFNYTPDLLRRNQLYVATMSIVQWREKFLRFIPLYPTKLSFVTQEGTPKITSENLLGRRYALLRNTTYETWLKSKINFDLLTIIDAENGEDAIRMVSTGVVEVAVSDTSFVLALMDDYPNITFYPADSQVDLLSWAVARDNLLLHGIFQKALDKLLRDSTFADIWEAYYPMPLSDYLSILDWNQ